MTNPEAQGFAADENGIIRLSAVSGYEDLPTLQVSLETRGEVFVQPAGAVHCTPAADSASTPNGIRARDSIRMGVRMAAQYARYAQTGLNDACSIRVPSTVRNCAIHVGCAGHAGAVTKLPSVTAASTLMAA